LSAKTHIAPSLDWDDLRVVLRVASDGSVAAAARRLGVNHTTVLRRVAAFEKRLGLRLFDRLPSGYTLTTGGADLVEAARRVEETVLEAERRLTGRDLALGGTLRVTTTDTLIASLLPQILTTFQAAHPAVILEIAASNAIANLTRREADVAIRPVADPSETLVGRRVSAVAFAVYAGRAAAARNDLPWLAPDDSLADSFAARWLRANVPPARVALRADSLVTLRDAAAAGAGLTLLPCYLGDLSSDLVRVRGPVKGGGTALWVLTHADLRHAARVRAFTEFAAARLAEHRALLEGKAAP
jgi:DNA-binding transcriptional LysR family regulator